ncbi:MAG: hypothetical protein AAF560_11830 [Acidobacteriota bacterium]
MKRETFSSRALLLATMIGVAVGLGNVWRFPYMVGKFGGASFVAFYLLAVLLLGIPALMAEWSLGRTTRRGPVGAFDGVGFPLGKAVGWFFFFVVTAATAYYTNALGWVLYYAVGQVMQGAGLPWSAGILPPETGFDGRSFAVQCAIWRINKHGDFNVNLKCPSQDQMSATICYAVNRPQTGAAHVS